MKVVIYECLRSLLYSPIYNLFLRPKDYGLEGIDLELHKTKKQPVGDLEALKLMLDNDKDSIPIAVCDPLAIFEHKEEKTYEDIKIIATIINRVSVWLSTLYYHSTSLSESDEKQNSFVRSLLEDPMDRSKLDEKTIYYCKKGVTTDQLFKYEFEESCDSKIRIFAGQLDDFGSQDELNRLKSHNLVLSNTPWLCDEIIKNSPDYNYLKEKNAKVVAIRDFGPKFFLFTGLVTKKSLTETKIDSDEQKCLQKVVNALSRSVQDLYDDPAKYGTALYLNSEEQKFDLGLKYSKPGVAAGIINDTLLRLANARVYSHSSYISYNAWKHSFFLRSKEKKHPETELQSLFNNLVYQQCGLNQFYNETRISPKAYI